MGGAMEKLSQYGRKWTRDETILALGLYFQIPFAKISSRNLEVRELARLMKRSPASLSMKMDNLGRFDPTLARQGISGLKNGSKGEREIWDEFVGRRDALSEMYSALRAKLTGHDSVEDDVTIKTPQGLDGVRLSKYRINQSFFRASVLSAYDNKCCITGIAIPKLLVASHIKPWSECTDGNERTDTQNGLCLNSLHDRAFDKGLFTLDNDCRIVLSAVLKSALPREVYAEQFLRYDGFQISLPDRGRPREEFLDYHRMHVFVG